MSGPGIRRFQPATRSYFVFWGDNSNYPGRCQNVRIQGKIVNGTGFREIEPLIWTYIKLYYDLSSTKTLRLLPQKNSNRILLGKKSSYLNFLHLRCTLSTFKLKAMWKWTLNLQYMRSTAAGSSVYVAPTLTLKIQNIHLDLSDLQFNLFRNVKRKFQKIFILLYSTPCFWRKAWFFMLVNIFKI